MRKSWLLLAAAVPLSALAVLGLPAIAASVGETAVTPPAAEVLDLDAIPVKRVAGRLSIKGLAIDDESDDDVRGLRKARAGFLSAFDMENDDDEGEGND